MGGRNFGNILPINVPKCHREKNHVFSLKKFTLVSILLSATHCLPFHYRCCWGDEQSHSGGRNHSENCMTIKVSRRTQKVEIYLANDGSGLAFFSTDLRHIFGRNVGKEDGVILRGKRPHKPELAYRPLLKNSYHSFQIDLRETKKYPMYLSLSIVLFRCLGKRPTSVSNLKDIVRIHSLMTYMDLIEYNIVCDKKASLVHCFLSISKLIVGVIRTTGLYMNYQTFTNLHFRPLLRNFYHSIHIDLRDTRKIPFVSVANNRLVLLFRKASNVCFQPKRRYKMFALRQVEIPFYRGIGRQRKRGFGAIPQVIGWTAIPFLRKYIVPTPLNAWVLTCWSLLCQKLLMLSVVEKFPRQLQQLWEDKLSKK